jgi:hypothetical protein
VRRTCLHLLRLLALAVLGPLALADPALADAGPYFEASALPEPGYELRLSLRYHTAEREDFSRPMSLFAYPIESLRARELRTELDLRLAITRRLALQASVPLLARELHARTIGLQVTASQLLPGRELELAGFGVGDPLLLLAYRLIAGPPFGLFAEVGTRLPIDDNPGSPVVPRRLPSSTGQNELLLGAGGNLAQGCFDVSLGYRLAYLPGNAATLLVRRVSNQGYTSGSFERSFGHEVSASLGVTLDPTFSLRVSPEWTAREIPLLVERNGTSQITAERFLHSLRVQGALRVELGGGHRLELSYAHVFLEPEEVDPFFPVRMPAQGPGLAWQVAR